MLADRASKSQRTCCATIRLFPGGFEEHLPREHVSSAFSFCLWLASKFVLSQPLTLVPLREQEVTLEDFRAETFLLVTQWIFQGKIILPAHIANTPAIDTKISGPNENLSNLEVNKTDPAVETSDKEMAQSTKVAPLSEHQIKTLDIAAYLEFLILALYLDVLGPFDSVHDAVKISLSLIQLPWSPITSDCPWICHATMLCIWPWFKHRSNHTLKECCWKSPIALSFRLRSMNWGSCGRSVERSRQNIWTEDLLSKLHRELVPIYWSAKPEKFWRYPRVSLIDLWWDLGL